MHNETLIQQALAFVKAKLQQDATGYDDWHAIRVWQLSKRIAKHEKCNLLVTELAAILHDIDDWKFNGGDTEKGGKVAKQFLLNLKVSDEIATKVADIITKISFKGANAATPTLSIEAKIVQDADRLDALGAIGIARVFACGNAFKLKIYEPDVAPILHDSFEQYKNKRSTSINHFYEKLLLLKDRLHTDAAKQLAKQRHQYMEDFLQQFHAEWRETTEAQ